MTAELTSKYSRFKQSSFSEQWLRFSNVLFVVFAYWNLLRTMTDEQPFSLAMQIMLAVAGVTTGVVFGLLLLLHLSRAAHCFLLPIAVAACAATIGFQDLSRLLVVPAVALVSIGLTKIIIASSNKINRIEG